MNYDLIVIGAGVCGLATAYQWLNTHPGGRLLLLEKEAKAAFHQSGRNSGVIHSGIYYKPGSQKALNCIRGYNLLLEFAKKHEVPFNICGKLIVATDSSELPALAEIHRRGEQNGLAGLKQLSPEETKEHEPHVRAVASLLVPQTGVIDFKAYAQALCKEIERMGGEIHFNEKLIRTKQTSAVEVRTSQAVYQTKQLVNCAGLYSDKVAGSQTDLQKDIRIIPFRGEYYELSEEACSLVKGLIYPVPNPQFPFLGVHFTRGIHGDVEAGPNAVFAMGREAYTWSSIHPVELMESLLWPGFVKLAAKHWKYGLSEMHRSMSKRAFTKALQKLIPEIQMSDLKPGPAGIRAQACHRNGQLVDDFAISQTGSIVHLLNAPSPAATSSLAIGETLVKDLS